MNVDYRIHISANMWEKVSVRQEWGVGSSQDHRSEFQMEYTHFTWAFFATYKYIPNVPNVPSHWLTAGSYLIARQVNIISSW
jgi:uncharacterized BrkB/YihY/UPF0761 family membrane protein